MGGFPGDVAADTHFNVQVFWSLTTPLPGRIESARRA
jgi:hypothetical protein